MAQGSKKMEWQNKSNTVDGSKIREIDYKYGGVILRTKWDEAGNLVKEETHPFTNPGV